MSGIFGWSYPPGCNGLPWDDDLPCEVCGKNVDDCICAECAVCGTQGDPKCYDEQCGHGLVRTQAQIDSLRDAMDKAEAIADAECEYWEAQAKAEAEACNDGGGW